MSDILSNGINHFYCNWLLEDLSLQTCILGVRRVGRKPEQQHPQVEGKPVDRRPDRRPQPRERRFERPVEEKADGGEFSTEKYVQTECKCAL